MIIVTGAVEVRPEALADALAVSKEHVHRSRQEPGCLSHDVAQDAGNPHRLMFIERWADAASLHAHFLKVESREFAQSLGRLSTEPPKLEIYAATPKKPEELLQKP